MSRILVGSTIPAFKMDADWHWWLVNCEAITAAAEAKGHAIDWLAVLQTDARGDEPFSPLLTSIDAYHRAFGVSFATYRFGVDTGDEQVTTPNRLASICIGRNLIIEHALRHGHDWIYFADADIEAPDDVLVRLLEVEWPVVGANVPTYCLDGERVEWISGAVGHRRVWNGMWGTGDIGPDIRRHWNTAGSLLVHRDVFSRVPWRHNPDAGETDDPATQAEMERLGRPTLVRHDVECRHHPECVTALEERGHDLSVYR